MVQRAAKTAKPAAKARPPVRARRAKAAKPARAEPADHRDPRFMKVLAAFAADPALAAIADDYIATQAAGGPRRFGSRALKVNGKIFAMVAHGKLTAKLSAARVAALVASGDGEYFDPGHGRKMKQWLALTSTRVSWIALAKEACAFVGGGS